MTNNKLKRKEYSDGAYIFKYIFCNFPCLIGRGKDVFSQFTSQPKILLVRHFLHKRNHPEQIIVYKLLITTDMHSGQMIQYYPHQTRLGTEIITQSNGHSHTYE